MFVVLVYWSWAVGSASDKQNGENTHEPLVISCYIFYHLEVVMAAEEIKPLDSIIIFKSNE